MNVSLEKMWPLRRATFDFWPMYKSGEFLFLLNIFFGFLSLVMRGRLNDHVGQKNIIFINFLIFFVIIHFHAIKQPCIGSCSLLVTLIHTIMFDQGTSTFGMQGPRR